MKKQFLNGLCAASLIAALAALSIPAEAAEMSCDVPFGFVVNGKALPAGTYHLSTERSALLVRGFGTGGAVVLTNALQSRKETGAKLVFHKYGDRYILREAWTGGHAGRAVPESSLERELKVRAASGGVALSLERVTVPAL